MTREGKGSGNRGSRECQSRRRRGREDIVRTQQRSHKVNKEVT